MIKYIKTNAVDYVLEKDSHVLIHVCNNRGVMGSGIAKEIKEKIPEAYRDYRRGYTTYDWSLGSPLGIISSDHNSVINMTCQDGYYGWQGDFSKYRRIDYGKLVSCLLGVKDWLRGEAYTTVVLPYKMGADRAGGDWQVIIELVREILGGYDIVVCEL